MSQAHQTTLGDPDPVRLATEESTEKTPPKVSWARRLGITKLSAVYLWALFILLFGIITPDTFLSGTTFTLVFRSGVVTCVLALAFLVPLTAGAYDLSIGAVMSIALGLVVYLSIHTSLSPLLTALIALIVSALCGAVSGFLVVRLRVNSFIATLGVSQVLLGAGLLLSDNTQLTADFPTYWSDLGVNDFLGIPIVIYLMVAIALVMWFVLEFTVVGRYLLATGGNPDAARLAGVPTQRLTWGVFVVSGLLSGMAGVIFSMQSGIYSTSIGSGYLFPAVAAVFLGASQLSQRPNVWGTLIAYFALAFGVQGLSLSASSAAVWSQPVFQGVSLIIAVALASRPALRKLRQANAESTPSTGA